MKMYYKIKILRISLYTVQSNGHLRMGGFAETTLHWEEVIQGQIMTSIFHLLCRRLLSFCIFKSLHFSMWTVMFWTIVLDEVVINRVDRNAGIHLSVRCLNLEPLSNIPDHPTDYPSRQTMQIFRKTFSDQVMILCWKIMYWNRDVLFIVTMAVTPLILWLNDELAIGTLFASKYRRPAEVHLPECSYVLSHLSDLGVSLLPWFLCWCLVWNVVPSSRND